ncbi:MAG: hypothetical protein JW726_00955 [Anaerolineales bacterium]|nr:hypothetical protein [Anaerolineales bacterium]
MESPTLSDFIAAFKQDDFITRLVVAGDEAPVDQLMVALEDGDYRPWNWRVELMYLPNLKDPSFLQYFAPLPFEYAPGRATEISRFCNHLNENLPLTGFGISEERGWVYFRHMMTCPDNGADPHLVVQTTWAIWYLIDRFGSLVKDIVEGHTNYEQACLALQENLQNWIPENWGGTND